MVSKFAVWCGCGGGGVGVGGGVVGKFLTGYKLPRRMEIATPADSPEMIGLLKETVEAESEGPPVNRAGLHLYSAPEFGMGWPVGSLCCTYAQSEYPIDTDVACAG